MLQANIVAQQETRMTSSISSDEHIINKTIFCYPNKQTDKVAFSISKNISNCIPSLYTLCLSKTLSSKVIKKNHIWVVKLQFPKSEKNFPEHNRSLRRTI